MSQTDIIISIFFIFAFYLWRKKRKTEQLDFIQSYDFSSSLLKRVQKKHDYLSDEDMKVVVDATKDYFYICAKANGKMISMPSEIVDVLWHEFILFTREYERFCQKSFGKFLHHTPTEAMKTPTLAEKGIKRAWRLACLKEHIDPKNPTKIPLLFHIDNLLEIKNGFIYELHCTTKGNSNYCATHIGCGSGFGSGCGSSCGSSSCSSGCGGGCGGD